MRRVAIFTAGAALVVGSLAIPGMAVATGRTTTPQNTTISAQSAQLDNEITAQGKGHGKGHSGKGYRKGHGRGHRHGYSHSRFRYGYYGHGYGYGYGGYWPGGYGGYGPGGYGGYGPGGYGGYWRGGFGCNFDYPCGPPYSEQCRGFRGAPPADPKCQAQQTEPAPGQSAQPTPDAGAQPAPAPDAGTQPAPAPASGQGDMQPRPY